MKTFRNPNPWYTSQAAQMIAFGLMIGLICIGIGCCNHISK